MVKKKDIIYGIILAFVLILFLWVVTAVVTSSPGMRVISPANFTNNSGTIIFNITYSNISSDIIDPRNVTFYYNLSANWASIQNSSAFVLNGSCFGASKACFVTLANGGGGYNLSDGTYTLNASLDNGTDQVSVSLTANMSVNVIIDNTRPIVFNGNITNPVTGTNYSGNLLLNVSVVDALATVRAVVFNITNSSSDQNATRIATQIGVIFFNFTISTSSFPDGLYNVSILANDTTTGGNVNNTAVVQLIRFDNTPPMSFNGNISSPSVGSNLSGTNRSGSIIINASLFDVTSGIRAVYFNITNGTGEQNATYTATREGTTNQYSVSVATTGFKDGNYSVTVNANDTTTGGNLNNSAKATEIKFDNTPPTVSVSCSPSTVQSGATITCTCTRSDATSGVKTVSFNANPSTSSTGTLKSECTVTDFAGNSATGSVNYIVESSGSGTSSGGGGGTATSTWTTYSLADEAFKTGHTRDLKENQRLKVNVETTTAGTTAIEEHFIGVVDVVSANSAVIEVSSTPQRVTMNVGETKQFEVTGDSFYDISVTLASILDSKAKITVLSIHEAIPAPEPAPAPVEEAPEVAAAPPPETKETSPWSIIALIVIAIIIAGAIGWYMMQKKN